LLLELDLGAETWSGELREPVSLPETLQALLWTGPGMDAAGRSLTRERVHRLVQEYPGHHLLLPEALHEGERPACPWVGESMDPPLGLGDCNPLRLLALGGASEDMAGWRLRIAQAGGVEATEDGPAIAVVRVCPMEPVGLLVHLFRKDLGLAGVDHPDLLPLRDRFQREVMAVDAPAPYKAAWDLLEIFQAREWLMGLPLP
jgi:hypothetical protein